MSEKACVSLLSPVWNRAQMAANCARVVGALGSKVSVLHPLHDAQTRHGGDGGICPIVIRNIGIGIAGQKIAVKHLIFQKPEENGGGLRTGDQSIWVNIAIIVTDDLFVGMIENFGRLLMQ